MAAVAVTASGVTATERKLSAVGRAAFQQEPVMVDAARRTARGVSGVPRDTGRLASSIDVLSTSPFGFDVGSDVPYARYVFRGTRYMAARPPRVPSSIAADTADQIGSRIVRA